MKVLPDKITIGEAYGPAMKIADPKEAQEYFEALVEHAMRTGNHTREKAIEIEKSNLGYFAGYYDDETRARVEKLFNCEHPILGPVSKGKPTPEEAFELGKKLAMQSKKQ